MHVEDRRTPALSALPRLMRELRNAEHALFRKRTAEAIQQIVRGAAQHASQPPTPVPTEVSARVQALVDAEELGVRNWVKNSCKKENGLLAHVSKGLFAYAVRPDGTVLEIDLDKAIPRAEVVTDPLHRFAIVVRGAVLHPELAELIPQPPPSTRLCASCFGTGDSRNPKWSCGKCDGWGWCEIVDRGAPGILTAEAGLELVRGCLGRCEYDEALRACEEVARALEQAPSDRMDAELRLYRILAAIDDLPDAEECRRVAVTLTRETSWEAASTAHTLYAEAVLRDGNLNEARGAFAGAIGCAELAGLRVKGPALLRQLAVAEGEAGNWDLALVAAEHAVARLDAVKLSWARFHEAPSWETAGDALTNLGRPDEARDAYRKALERYEWREHQEHVDRVTQKLDALAAS